MKIYLTLSLLSMLIFGVNKNSIKKEYKNQIEIQYQQIQELECKLDSLTQEYNGIKPNYLLSPLKGDIKITSLYGKRKDPIHGNIRNHNGIDIKQESDNTDKYVYASHDGVIKVDNNVHDCNGLSVEIFNHTYNTKYFHLSKILVKNKQYIKQGDIIGIIGNTGKSTGTHLHYEVYKLDENNKYELVNPSSELYIPNI